MRVATTAMVSFAAALLAATGPSVADEVNALDVNGVSVAEIVTALGATPHYVRMQQFPGFVRISLEADDITAIVKEKQVTLERQSGEVATVSLLPTRGAGPAALRIVFAADSTLRRELHAANQPAVNQGSDPAAKAAANAKLADATQRWLNLALPVKVYPAWDWTWIEVTCPRDFGPRIT